MMLNPEGIPLGANGTEAAPDPNAALRFEDLTIDDDLSLLDRVVRYVRSGIALQRLVHVKMIAETAKTVGTASTINTILPLLPTLILDQESIIRQHLAAQLLPLCLTCMFGDDENFDPQAFRKSQSAKNTENSSYKYNSEGYTIATLKIVHHINILITDPDMDVRKAASDALATLALYIKPQDIPSCILPTPLRLVQNIQNEKSGGPLQGQPGRPGTAGGPGAASNNNDDFCITASNLLADIASLDSTQVPPSMVAQYITPTIVALCKHSSFRVRRAAVQALPRVIGGSSMADVQENLMPCFIRLSKDEVYRVRKSVGECLVDMSRSLMLLPASLVDMGKPLSGPKRSKQIESFRLTLQEMRRNSLIPICTRLLQDTNKVVRHGMMQFLGPFIASFYPLEGEGYSQDDENGIMYMLGGKEAENSVGGLGVQFFPHANGMVSRLNPDNISAAVAKKTKAPTPRSELPIDSVEFLESHLPSFLEKCHNDAMSLFRILQHRIKHPVPAKDITAVKQSLMPSYVNLSSINTGDSNVDAEMRVYCAYSLPGIILLLGQSGWEDSLKACFFQLITGSSISAQSKGEAALVPLPVKRCLASSFHTVCNMLGPSITKTTLEEKANKLDLLTIFEVNFLGDADETVRLNVIRNLPSFLSLLSFSKRSNYLPVLYEIIKGDTMLASKRTNVLNPILLNWRQRDMIAQILPNLISLYRADQVRQYLWPIVKILLSDAVNIVRENVEWSIPILLRCYEVGNCSFGGEGDVLHASKFSTEACDEVFLFLKDTLLNNSSPRSAARSSAGAFSKRQSYCRILSAVALILRLNIGAKSANGDTRDDTDGNAPPQHPFYTLSSVEYTHLHQLLKKTLLPSALLMKEDKVTNVRLALAKCLRVMPLDIRDRGKVGVVLRTLEDEIQTWEGGGGQDMDSEVPTTKKIQMSGMSLAGSTSTNGDPKAVRVSGNIDMQGTTGNSMETSSKGSLTGDSRRNRASKQNDEDSSLASI